LTTLQEADYHRKKMRFTLAGHDERQKVQEQVDAASSEEGGELFDARKERKFVRKLDCILVTWAFFAYLLKVSLRHFDHS
jgi:hypothetical protein